ncbi:MAG: DUF1858 domain-containing protein [Sulfitobacter sp.]
MQNRSRPLSDLSLVDMMDRWPQTIEVFIRNKMLCVGCSIAPFHTIHDACVEHDLDEQVICDELSVAIDAG